MYTKREYNRDVEANAQAMLDNLAVLADFNKRHEAGETVDFDAWNAAHDRNYDLENERRAMDQRFRQRKWTWQDHSFSSLVSQNID